MANSELRKLKRRELLKMLLIQCQETERLEKELGELKEEHGTMAESYERLKEKLNVKDERLNQKDAQIKELQDTIEEMKMNKAIELAEAGNIAEAALRLNGIFELAQQAADQYLMNVRWYADAQSSAENINARDNEKQIPFETGWRAGIRRKPGASRTRQVAIPGYGQTDQDIGQRVEPDVGDSRGYRVSAASGEIHG